MVKAPHLLFPPGTTGPLLSFRQNRSIRSGQCSKAMIIAGARNRSLVITCSADTPPLVPF